MDIKELYYTVFRGVRKNIKIFYYLRGITNVLTPKCCSKLQKKHLYKYYDSLSTDEKAYVDDRVEYYCKLISKKTIPDSIARKLADHTYKQKIGNSVYFFDTYEYTRYFPDEMKFAIVPGDITKVCDYPAIVKSRPISNDTSNENSVLLNMDKVRHFVFINDPFRFEDKKDVAIFRGAIGQSSGDDYKKNRFDFMQKFFGNAVFDGGDVAEQKNGIKPEWCKPKISIYKHLSYKFILALEGNDVASNLKWVMSSNSLAVMPKPRYETWFMEGRLKPNYHYVEIADDYHDFEEKIEYYSKHTDEAYEIIGHAHEYVAQFKNKKREKLISLKVVEKYLNAVN